MVGEIAGADAACGLIRGLVIDRPSDFIRVQVRDLIEKRIEGGRRVQRREHSGIVDVLETIESVGCVGEYDSATAERVFALMTPLVYQTGPKTSAKSGWSRSMREKRCISGRSLASGIMGIRS